MGYVDKHLMADETIVFQTKVNWTEYLKGLVVLLFGLSLGNLIIILIGVVLLGLAYMKISSSEFAVTDKRVLIKVGIFKTRSLETMLNKVEGIHVEQGIIGKMVNSGSIVVKGTGGTDNPFPNIDHPYEFRAAVTQQISKV